MTTLSRREVCTALNAQMIQVGDYTLVSHDDTFIWIEYESGEGGLFPIEQLEETIAKYFKERV
jgi:hypothetical protein